MKKLSILLVFSLVLFTVFVHSSKVPLSFSGKTTAHCLSEVLTLDENEEVRYVKDKDAAKQCLEGLDFGKLSEDDLKAVDKFVQNEPKEKQITQKYFGKISNGKLEIMSGNDLTWDGEVLTTKSGAFLDPKNLPKDVVAVKEVGGHFIFTHEPKEVVTINGEKITATEMGKPAKVTLLKGTFESLSDGTTKPSPSASFIIEEGSVEFDGTSFHPDQGKIEQLDHENFRITDNNLQDGDAAGISIGGEKRGDLNADTDVYAKQQETFVGTREDLFQQAKNGVHLAGNDISVRGDILLGFSELDKDTHFARYTFTNGILDEESRKVTDRETFSQMRIHYEQEGQEVIWNVDEDDYEAAPPRTSHAGDYSEVRRKDEKAGLILEEPPEEAGVPLQKAAPKPVEEDQEEEKPLEKKPEEKPAQKVPVQKRIQTSDESVLADMTSAAGESLIVPKDSLAEETKKNVRARQATEFSFTAYSKSQVKKEMEANYNRLTEPEKRLADEFKKDHEADLKNWLANNMGGGVNKFRARMVGDKAVLEIHGGRSYFIFDKKYLPVVKKTLSYSIF